ncbi:uncharacterized protein LOC135389315 [Ornithodoros turicata]|uniref:uncharacterized protein LOC135389315 n=1 Tax=Ornithodoros turicata TaxID=34597 RepID=UPI0031389E40
MNTLGTLRIRTTAYHRSSNGVERLHRQTKVALRATPETPWPEAIPVILLGIRTAFKPDFGGTSADMVYGSALRLPGDLVAPAPIITLSRADFVSRLQGAMASLRPESTRQLARRPAYQHPELSRCTHVFVRCNSVRKSLQPPYTGPHPVLHRSSSFFTVLINGRQDNVNIERLKPAWLDSTPPASTIPAVSFIDDSLPSLPAPAVT